jgi:hypothetical protein
VKRVASIRAPAGETWRVTMVADVIV